MLRDQLLDTSRGRIVSLLRHGELTAEEIATRLGLTASAVRVQLTGMERDGVVRRVGRRPGTTRPSQVFELTPEVEQLLSRAYRPLLTQLVQTFSRGFAPRQVDALMRNAGKGLANELLAGSRPTGSVESRATIASQVLNDQLGALTHVERDGGFVIRGVGCPLSVLTGKHPAVCLAMASLVAEIVGVTVQECCDRSDRPRCCFQIAAEALRPRRRRRRMTRRTAPARRR